MGAGKYRGTRDRQSTAESAVLVGESTPETKRADLDEALRAAAKVAIDAGDFKRATALLAMLDAPDIAIGAVPNDAAEPTKIVALSGRRRG